MSFEGVPLDFSDSPIERKELATVVRADMPEGVLDGRLGEIYTRQGSQLPIAYAWVALVTLAGSLVSRSSPALRTNLFWCAVGPPGSGKSQSFEIAARVLGMWQGHPALLKRKFGSSEGLIERVQGDGSQQVVVFVDEMSHLMSKASIDRSSFAPVLNTAYYEDQQSGGTKGKQFNLDCRLSIAGGIPEESFGDSFGLATTGGLYDRFLFGLCPEPYQFLWRPFEGQVEKIDPTPALVEPAVWDVRDQWVKDGISPRIAELALRVAYICACVDGRPSLRGSELEPALQFAKYQTRVRQVLAPNPGENPDARCANAIRNWLASHAPHGRSVRRRDLDRGISSNRYGPGVFNRCLNNLLLNNEIDVEENKVRLKGENE